MQSSSMTRRPGMALTDLSAWQYDESVGAAPCIRAMHLLVPLNDPDAGRRHCREALPIMRRWPGGRSKISLAKVRQIDSVA